MNVPSNQEMELTKCGAGSALTVVALRYGAALRSSFPSRYAASEYVALRRTGRAAEFPSRQRSVSQWNSFAGARSTSNGAI